MKKSEMFWNIMFIIFLIGSIVVGIIVNQFNLAIFIIFGAYFWICAIDAISALTFDMIGDWNIVHIIGKRIK